MIAPQTFMGMKIVVSDTLTAPQPKLQLNPFLDCISDEMREEMNAYLLRMFGKTISAYVLNNDTLIVHSETMKQLRQIGRIIL